jgi:hypothetical protein
MSGSAIDKPTDTVGGSVDTLTDYLHHLTPTQFRGLGVPLVVYLRSCVVDGEVVYAIHTADGALRSVVEDIDTATALASEWGMAVVTVH